MAHTNLKVDIWRGLLLNVCSGELLSPTLIKVFSVDCNPKVVPRKRVKPPTLLSISIHKLCTCYKVSLCNASIFDNGRLIVK